MPSNTLTDVDTSLRNDGTKKDVGYYGELKRPDGFVSTELSVGVDFGQGEMEIPLLVPGLNQQQIDSLLRDEDPSDYIMDIAVTHAKRRLKEGKSPFYDSKKDGPVETVDVRKLRFDQIDAAEEQKKRIKSIKTGDDAKLFDDMGKGIDHAYTSLPEHKKRQMKGMKNVHDMTRKIYNIKAMSKIYGKEYGEIVKKYDQYKQQFGSKVLGMSDEIDDARFYDGVVKWRDDMVTKDENRSKIVQELALRSKDYVMNKRGNVADFLKKELPTMDTNDLEKAEVVKVIQNQFRYFSNIVEPNRKRVEKLIDLMKEDNNATEDGFSPRHPRELDDNERMIPAKAEMEKIIKEVSTLSEEEQDQFIWTFTKMAEQEPGVTEGFFDSNLSSLTRTTYDTYSRAYDTAAAGVARLKHDATNRPGSLWGRALRLNPIVDKGLEEAGVETTPLKEADPELHSEQRLKTKVRELKSVVAKLDDDSVSWMNEEWERASHGISGTLGYMGTMAIPKVGPAIIAADFTRQAYEELDRYSPEMSENDKERMALMFGAFNASVERLQLKGLTEGFPVTRKLLKRMKVTGALPTAIGASASGAVTETFQEHVQQGSVAVGQELISKIDPNISPAGRERLAKALTIDPEIVRVTVPLGILGGFGRVGLERIGLVEAKNYLANPLVMEVGGVSPEVAADIAETATKEGVYKAQKKLEVYQENTTKEELEANQKQAERDGKVKALRMQELQEQAEHGKTQTIRDDAEAKIAFYEYLENNLSQIEEVDDGYYQLIYPEFENRPNDTFESEEEAIAAQEAYNADTAALLNGELVKSAENIEARQLAVGHLESAHEGAEGVIDDKKVTVEQAIKEGKASLDQMLERDRISALENGLKEGRNLRELMQSQILGEVKLRQAARGYVMRLHKGSSVATVFEEGSEGYIRDQIERGLVTMDFLKFHMGQIQKDSGEKLFEDPDNVSDQQAIEAFSKLARAHIWNNRDSSVLHPKLAALINSLRAFFRTVFKTADNLMELKKQGLLDEDIERHLDRSVGLDEDSILENERRKHERELLEEASDPDTEIQVLIKGKLPRPSDMQKGDLFYGEIKDLFDHFRRESRHKTTKDGKARVTSSGASALFAPKGSKIDLDMVRESLNEQGFDFDTPAEMLEALDDSLRGMKQFPVVDRRAMDEQEKGRTFSIGNTQVTPNNQTQSFPTEDGGVVGPATFSLQAFHGTPHKVDRFSSDNIGSGEGAQAFGWGLYFADNKDVAENYRINLAYDPDEMRINGRQINDEYRKYVEDYSSGISTQIAEGIERLMMHDSPSDVIEYFEDNDYDQQAIKYFKESNYETFGKLYSVDLNVEESELLDWDKPMSEQPQIIAKLGEVFDVSNEDAEGRTLYHDLVSRSGMRAEWSDYMGGGWEVYGSDGNKLGFSQDHGKDVQPSKVISEFIGYGDLRNSNTEPAKKASQLLASHGIKGIKYLDGNSRADGEGSYNYVIFDDADITITHENGEVVDTSTFSLSDPKPYKDRAGDEHGEPLTPTEIAEGIEDESGTLGDVEIDDDLFSDERSDKGATYSIASDIPKIYRADLKGKKKFVYFSDRTRVGVYRGLDESSGIMIDLQGGPKYPYIDGHNGAAAGWAFTTLGMFTRFQKRVNSTDGIGLTVLYSKENLRANPTFLKAYVAEVEYAIASKKLTKTQFLKTANELRIIAKNSKKTNRNTGEKTPVIPVDSEAGILFKKAWKSVDDFAAALGATTFDVRSGHFFGYNPNVAKENKGVKIGADKLLKLGFPNITEMINLFADPDYEGMPAGHIVGAVQFEKNQNKGAYTAEDIGAETHASYPVVTTGKGIGLFKDPISVMDVVKIPTKNKKGDIIGWKDGRSLVRSAETSMAETTFSITPAQDAAYMQAVESGDVETQQRMVDEAAKAAGYGQEGYRAGVYRDDVALPPSARAAFGSGYYAAYGRGAEKLASEFDSELDTSLKGDDSISQRTEKVRVSIKNPLIYDSKTRELKVTPEEDAFIEAERQLWLAKNEAAAKASRIDESHLSYVRKKDLEKLGINGREKAIKEGVKGLNYYTVALQLMEDGRLPYDGIKAERPGVPQKGGSRYVSELVVPNKNQIKSAEPVTYDSSGNVIPLSERFNEQDDRITYSLAAPVDPVAEKIRSLMRDPDKRLAMYKTMEQKLRKIQDGIDERMIRKMFDDEDYNASKADVLESLAKLQAVVSVLPMEVRGKIGGWRKIASYKTRDGVERYLVDRLDKVDKELEKYLQKEYRERIGNILDKGKPTKGKNEKVAKGNLTPEVHTELQKIKIIFDMSDDKLAEEVTKTESRIQDLQAEEADTQEKQDDIDKDILEAEMHMARLTAYGKMNSKKDPMSSEGLALIHEDLDKMVTQGRVDWAIKMLKKKERRDTMADNVLHEVSGGEGTPKVDSADYKKKSEQEKRQRFRTFLKDYHAHNISFEHLLNWISRLSDSEAFGSYLNTEFGERVHKATHGEARAVAVATVELEHKIAEIFGIDPIKVGWHGKVIDKMASLAERKETGIIRYENIEREELKMSRADAEAVVDGKTTKVDIDGELVDLSKGEVSRVQDQLNLHPKAKTIQIVRVRRKDPSEQYLSEDEMMFLTMMYRQEGLRDTMEYHGYDEDVMSQMETVLSDEAKVLRSWLFKKYDGNYEYFNDAFKEIFGLNLPKVKNYSPAKSYHRGKHAQEMIDADKGRMSTTPGMAMERIQHKAAPRNDISAIQTYIHHIEATEHFVHWADLVGDLRSVFNRKEVREAIIYHHGKDVYQTIVDRIEMFAAGGNPNAKPMVWLDKLRKNFTVAKLAYNWGVMLKQLTSLPAYMYDMDVWDYTKYQTEFFKNPIENLKFMWNLDYTQERWGSGYDRDVNLVLSQLDKQSKLGKVAHAGMKFGQAGDIVPVMVGGYAAYRNGYEKSKQRNPKADESVHHERGITAFEMATDRAQQSGHLKDQSDYALGHSLARVMTMFTTSPRQYMSNSIGSFIDLNAGREGAKKRFAKHMFISHVILPSLFHFASVGVRNAFKSDDEDEEYLGRSWVASMLLGPLSGYFVLGHGLASISSGYSYQMPVLETFKELGKGGKGAVDILSAVIDENDEVTTRDVIDTLDALATSASLWMGEGALLYDIAKGRMKSFGVDKDDLERLTMNEVDGQVHDLGEVWNKAEKEHAKDPADPENKDYLDERYDFLAGEYQQVKDKYSHVWDEIAEGLREEKKLPKKLEELIE